MNKKSEMSARMTKLAEKPTGISIVVPVCSRFDNLSEVVTGYADAMSGAGVDFELIVVLDGPKPAAREMLQETARNLCKLTVIELSRQFGESAALTAGFDQARGELIMTLPPILQVDPQELPKLVDEFTDRDDMILGVRSERAGSALDSVRRETFHRLFRFVTGLPYRDLGCTVRLMRRKVVEETPLYGDQHRFFPALASRQGFRIRELELTQAAKDRFRGRPSARQYLHRLLDILSIFFLIRFTKKPLRFFGMIGTLTGAVGVLLVATMVVQRLFFGIALAERPALLLSSLLVVLGVQIFALGLIGELIIFTHAGQMKEYAVRAVIESSVSDDPDKDAA